MMSESDDLQPTMLRFLLFPGREHACHLPDLLTLPLPPCCRAL